MRLNTLHLSSVCCQLVLASMLVSCDAGHGHEAESEEHHHDHHDEIVMSPSDALRFGVKAEAVGLAPFSEIVKVVGEIMPASTDRSVVSAPTAGVVRLRKGLEVGSNVRQGESIAVISAKNISGGDTNVASKANLEASKRELDRVTPLLKDGIVTRKDYNEALRAYEEAKSSYSPAAASGSVVSSLSGVVSDLAVADGAYVEAGQPIATIGRNTRLTLRALLPVSDAAFLPRIVSANIRASHGGGVIALLDRNGVLLSSSISGGVSTPGYVPVYFSFDSNGDVIPGTPADVYLVGAERAECISVPTAAVSEQQGENFVYVKVDDHAYRKQPVRLGHNDGCRVEVIEGVNPGDSVVTAGTTFVRLAETSTVVPEGHSHSH